MRPSGRLANSDELHDSLSSICSDCAPDARSADHGIPRLDLSRVTRTIDGASTNDNDVADDAINTSTVVSKPRPPRRRRRRGKKALTKIRSNDSEFRVEPIRGTTITPPSELASGVPQGGTSSWAIGRTHLWGDSPHPLYHDVESGWGGPFYPDGR